jgi:hypothetical protein
MKVKKEPKILMASTRRNLFLRPKMKTNPSWTNSFSDPKGEVSNLRASFKNRSEIFFMWTAMKSRHTAERQKFFFGKIGFSSIKSPNSSRKSIKKMFKSLNQCFILTSFIGSKKFVEQLL